MCIRDSYKSPRAPNYLTTRDLEIGGGDRETESRAIGKERGGGRGMIKAGPVCFSFADMEFHTDAHIRITSAMFKCL